MDRLILASTSPRRAGILSSLGFSFETVDPRIDEDVSDLDAETAVVDLARRKLHAAVALLEREGSGIDRTGGPHPHAGPGPEAWILAADTLVWKDPRVFGKARGREEAKSMLLSLSGTRHSVSTGLAVLSPGGELRSESFSTEVHFKSMTHEEIDWYLSTGEWEGVAGAYRIQGRGAFFVKEIIGEYHTVVGLPISGLYDILRASGFRL